MGSWFDPDGLYRKYGTDKAVPNKGGEYRNDGHLREVEVKLTLSGLTESETIQSDQIFIPAGARLQEVEVVTQTAAATGVAIDLGLIRTDRSTEIDYDGLLKAFPTGSMDAAGETTSNKVGATYAGDLIGTTLANVGYISCSRTTSTAFTNGVIFVTIRYYMP